MAHERTNIGQRPAVDKSSKLVSEQIEASSYKLTKAYEAYLKSNESQLTKVIRDMLKQ